MEQPREVRHPNCRQWGRLRSQELVHQVFKERYENVAVLVTDEWDTCTPRDLFHN